MPIYSFRFLSSHSDGPCLIFTSIYINYASHYKRRRGGGWGKEKHKDAHSPHAAHRVEIRRKDRAGKKKKKNTKNNQVRYTSDNVSPARSLNIITLRRPQPNSYPCSFLILFFSGEKFLFSKLSSRLCIYTHTCVCVWARRFFSFSLKRISHANGIPKHLKKI